MPTDPTLTAQQPEQPPWHAAFPPPEATPGVTSAEKMLDMIKHSLVTNKPSYLLVDVRRADHEGGTISTSINLPAQSMPLTLPSLVNLVTATESIKSAIFYCGSSRGRGPRSAAWFQDELDRQGITDVKGLVLEGGIKGWVKRGRQEGGDFLHYMEGFNSEYWDQVKAE